MGGWEDSDWFLKGFDCSAGEWGRDELFIMFCVIVIDGFKRCNWVIGYKV